MLLAGLSLEVQAEPPPRTTDRPEVSKPASTSPLNPTAAEVATLDALLIELRGTVPAADTPLSEGGMAGQVMAQMEPYDLLTRRIIAATAASDDPEQALAVVVRQSEASRVWLQQLRRLQPPAGSTSELTASFISTRDEMVQSIEGSMSWRGLVDVPVLAPLVEKSKPDVLRAWTLYRRAYGRWTSPPPTRAEEAADEQRERDRMDSQITELRAAGATITLLVAQAPSCIPGDFAQRAAFPADFLADQDVDREVLQIVAEYVENTATDLREAWACTSALPPPELRQIESRARDIAFEYLTKCGYGSLKDPPPPPVIWPAPTGWSPPVRAEWKGRPVSALTDLDSESWRLNNLVTRIAYSFGEVDGHPNATDIAAMTRAIDQLELVYQTFEANAAPLVADPTTEARARLQLARAREGAVFLLLATRENVRTFSDGQGTPYESWAQARFIEHITAVAEDELDRADDWLDPLLAIGVERRPATDAATLSQAVALEWAVLADSRKIVPRKPGEFGG